MILNIKKDKCRDVAQPGSAPAWGAGGRRFKSCRPDHFLWAFSEAWLFPFFLKKCPSEKKLSSESQSEPWVI